MDDIVDRLNYGSQCPVSSPGGDLARDMQDGAEEIMRLRAEVFRLSHGISDGIQWTPVAKLLPAANYEEVLIFPGRYGSVSIGSYERLSEDGYWIDKTEWVGDEGSHSAIAVTHWMLLPGAPK